MHRILRQKGQSQHQRHSCMYLRQLQAVTDVLNWHARNSADNNSTSTEAGALDSRKIVYDSLMCTIPK